MINLKKYIYLSILFASPTGIYSSSTDGVILLNTTMPAKETSVVATQSVVLKPGFNASGQSGVFNAKIGYINSVYPSTVLPVDGRSMLLAPVPAEYVAETKNYIKTTVPLEAKSLLSELNRQNSLITNEYLDGLGQTSLVVQKGYSPTGKDVAVALSYDAYGRMTKEWLPTPISSTSTPNTEIVIQQAKNYYADYKPYTSICMTGDVDEENINTVALAPGEKWHNGNKTQTTYVSNTRDYDDGLRHLIVKRYIVVGDSLKLLSGDGDLYLKSVENTDEDNRISYKCFDKDGRLMLQRGVDNGVNHDTYYVYDEVGRLRFVLSPEATDALSQENVIYSVADNSGNNALAHYAYIYKYDMAGHCTEKKIPGKGWEKMIYDQGGRLAFSQDGNQRTADLWTFYQYDTLDRLVRSGTTTFTDFDTKVAAYSATNAEATFTAGTGYVSSAPLGSNTVVLAQNFYDTYDFIALLPSGAQKDNLAYTAGSEITGVPDTRYVNTVEGSDIGTLGQLTGTTVTLLDNTKTIVTAMYYNDKGQIVQSKSNNHLDGVDNDFWSYNFSGNPLVNKHMHSANGKSVSELYTYSYDNSGRLLSLNHSLNGNTNIVLESFVYDDLGRVSKKILHGGMETVGYTYNIHNQLKSISSAHFSETLHYEESDPNGSPCFNGNISSIDNGNSASIAGGISGYGNGSKYRFTYDGLNRLKTSSFSDPNNFRKYPGSLDNQGYNGVFNETTTFDKNSNPVNITRSGLAFDLNKNTTAVHQIDEINLSYNGNQIISAQDAQEDANNQNAWVYEGDNDFNDVQDATHTTEYLYDANGNQIADLNKGIAWQRYNLLNLPEKIQFANGDKTEYSYDAVGEKHRAVYSTVNNTMQIPLGVTTIENTTNIKTSITTDYCGRYIYENNDLKRILTPEGYIEVTGASEADWRYAYHLKDHLDNVRVELLSDRAGNAASKNATVTGVTDFYPSGMEIDYNCGNTSGANTYLYGDKEIDRMHGLNRYDFSGRWYDHAIQAFTTIDPHAENHYSESPYSYCAGNPVNRVDPTGLDWYKREYTSDIGFTEGSANWYETSDGSYWDRIGPTITFTINGVEYYGNQSGAISRITPINTDKAERVDNNAIQNNPQTNSVYDYISHFVGPNLIALGSQTISKPFSLGKAATMRTSVASTLLRKALPFRSPVIKKVTTILLGKASSTAVLGGAIGRLVPIAGWILTGADVAIFALKNGNYKDFKTENESKNPYVIIGPKY